MPKVSPERLAQTRQRIIDATAECLAELGVEGTTTRAVARRAGVANGLLYRYFPTKEELYVAVASREAAERTPSLLDGSGAEDHASLLHAVASSLFDGSPTASSVLPALRASAVVDPDVRAALRRYDADLSRHATPVLAAADDQGSVSTDDPEATVEVIQALFEGIQARLASDTVTTSPARIAAAAVAFVDRLANR